jgi:RNA polymerase sigma-70 factor (ECF subfamily)
LSTQRFAVASVSRPLPKKIWGDGGINSAGRRLIYENVANEPPGPACGGNGCLTRLHSLAEATSPEQLSRLVDEHAAALELFARQWTPWAEDVVQEAFMRLVAQPNGPENPKAWLYAVVRNGAMSAARSAQRRLRHETQAGAERPEWFQPSEHAPLEAAAATNALAQLPLADREIIVAHLWGRLTFEQIAELVGATSSTAHRRYVAGLTRLRELLEKPCDLQNQHTTAPKTTPTRSFPPT